MFTIFPRLKERRDQLAGTMSGGEKTSAMARALMSRPKVLLLDEPSMGLSPIMVDKIFEVVQDGSGEARHCIVGRAKRQPCLGHCQSRLRDGLRSDHDDRQR